MMCDFNTGFKPPEIVKRRPVITVSKARNDGAPLCSVIPISSTKPKVVRDFHYLLPSSELPKHLQGQYQESWVKIDMIMTVGFSRLTMLWNGRDGNGARVYQTGKIGQQHIDEISTKLLNRLAL
jgi:uncharacterized protein YifN (PemK superfamily)